MTILRDLSILWSAIHVLILFIFLYESRYSPKKTLAITCIFMTPVIILNIWGFIKFGPEIMGQLLILTCTIPSFIFFFIMAKNRNTKFLFTFCLIDTLSLEILIITNLIDFYLPGKHYIVMFVTRLIAFPLFEFFMLKFIRKPYAEIQNRIEKGWGAFTAISAIYYILLVLVTFFPTIITSRREYIPSLIFLIILMPLTYLNMFRFMRNQININNMEQREQALHLQAVMMNQRLEQIQKKDEAMRIWRHNVRHKMQTVSAMLQKGECEEALKYITDSEIALDKAKTTRYCSNPTLDAVFSYSCHKAEELKIRMELTISIPDDLTVNATDLSIVFANSLENAINACKKLPEEQRRICCKCIGKPQLLFQVSNPYVGKINFDSNGQPITAEDDHGLGTRSIVAFCDKYNAYSEYKTDNGWFTFRIALP